jgi:hypothetical protein
LIQYPDVAKRSTASIPPNSAQLGGNQPCSIQQIAAAIAATESKTPSQGCPSQVPMASTRP